MGRTGDPDFAAWLLSHYERSADPRMERYWCLISTLKRTPFDPTLAEAYRWLVEGLRMRVMGCAP